MTPLRQRLLRAAHAAAPGTNAHVDAVERAFMDGYTAALTRADLELVGALAAMDPFFLAYAWEGAGMALAMLAVLGEDDSIGAVLDGLPEVAGLLLCVGAGVGLAKVGRTPLEVPVSVAGWAGDRAVDLVADGHGFYTGRFEAWRLLGRRRVALPAGVGTAFDRGLGRSLFFVYTHDVDVLSRCVEGFAAVRREALWLGVGVACAFTGGMDAPTLGRLADHAGPMRGSMRRGAADGATLREAVSGPSAWADMALEIVADR